MSPQTHKCPDCRGNGKIAGVACPGFVPVEFECALCGGSGNITTTVRDRALKAIELRDARRIADVSLREFASAARIKPSRVSDIERGRVEPTVAELAAYKRLIA